MTIIAIMPTPIAQPTPKVAVNALRNIPVSPRNQLFWLWRIVPNLSTSTCTAVSRFMRMWGRRENPEQPRPPPEKWTSSSSGARAISDSDGGLFALLVERAGHDASDEALTREPLREHEAEGARPRPLRRGRCHS